MIALNYYSSPQGDTPPLESYIKVTCCHPEQISRAHSPVAPWAFTTHHPEESPAHLSQEESYVYIRKSLPWVLLVRFVDFSLHPAPSPTHTLPHDSQTISPLQGVSTKIFINAISLGKGAVNSSTMDTAVGSFLIRFT